MASNDFIHVLAYLIGWCLVGVIIYGSLSQSPVTENMGINDKFQHCASYLFTMAWFGQVLRSNKQLFFHSVFLVLLAIAMESIQLVIQNRVYDPADMLSSMGGVVLGLLVPRFLLEQCLLVTGLTKTPHAKSRRL